MALTAPQTPEIKPSPVTGAVPENAKEAANPALENKGVVPQLPSTQLSHIAKKEARVLADREVLKKEQEALRLDREKVDQILKIKNDFDETRKKDPIKALRDIGFTEKEIVDYLSQEDAPKLSTEEIVQLEIKKMREDDAKKATEAQKANDTILVNKFKSSLSEVVATDPLKYELCAHHGPMAEEIMFNLAVEEAKEGKIPDPKSIAEEVENFYYEQKISMDKLKKFAPKEDLVPLTPKVIERTRTVHPSQDVVKPKATTLTNKLAATSAAIAKPANRTESPSEKRARLEAMIRIGFSK